MKKLIIVFLVFVFAIVPVFASDIEPGEIPGNTEETYPEDLPVFFSEPDFSIVMQPVSKTVAVNKTASFTVLAVGENLSYKWQYSINGGKTWYASSASTQGYNTPTLTVVASSSRDGYKYRCIVSNDSGLVTTEAVTLSVITDGSAAPIWSPSDVLFLFTYSLVAVGNWFGAIMSATGMYAFYTTMIIIVLAMSIILSHVLPSGLFSLSDAVRRTNLKSTRRSDDDSKK